MCIIFSVFFLGAFSVCANAGTVTIKLDPNKGKIKVKSLEADTDAALGKLPKPKRDGYQFKGWYTSKKGGNRVTSKTAVQDVDVSVLYAHWKTVQYTIKYEYNEGTLPAGTTNPEYYTVKQTVKLQNPSKAGYIFKGWYTAADPGKGKHVKKIKKGSTGDLELFAVFEPQTYTIRFKKNGVLKKGVKKITARYGETVTLPSSKEEAFASWNTSPDGSGKQYQAGQKVSDLTPSSKGVVTLYANPFITGNNIQKLYDYFQRIGFTKEASAAIVGNLMYESGGGYSDVKLNAVEWSTGRGIGMCQWTDTADMKRRTNFERYCASKGKPWPNQDLKVQVDFLMLELEGQVYGKVWYFLPEQGYPSSYEMSLKKFKKLKNVSTAVAVFCANFERPRPEHANLSARTSYARSVMGN